MSKGSVNKKPDKSNNIIIISIAIVFIVILAVVIYNNSTKKSENDTGNTTAKDESMGGNQGNGVVTENGDLVIPINDITSKATFYPLEVEGTKVEILAVEAPDGTIRTAFNTCQICYSSGRGYYKQSGDKLVCQNCGNAFGMDEVESAKGGCNPYPIFVENKTVDAENITISNEFLKEMNVLFTNWVTEFQ